MRPTYIALLIGLTLPACGDGPTKNNVPDNNTAENNDVTTSNNGVNNTTSNASNNASPNNSVPRGECSLQITLTGALEETLAWGLNEGCGGGADGTEASVGFGGLTTDTNVRVEMTGVSKGEVATGVSAVVRVRNDVDDIEREWLASDCTVDLETNGFVESNIVGDVYRLAGSGSCSSTAVGQNETTGEVSIDGAFAFDATVSW